MNAMTCGSMAGACVSAAVRNGRTQGVAYHRPAQEGVRADASGDAPSSIERLPKVERPALDPGEPACRRATAVSRSS